MSFKRLLVLGPTLLLSAQAWDWLPIQPFNCALEAHLLSWLPLGNQQRLLH